MKRHESENDRFWVNDINWQYKDKTNFENDYERINDMKEKTTAYG